MTADSWPRVKRALETVLSAPSDARDAALERACGDDSDLRREVEAYLSYETRAERFLPDPGSRSSPVASSAPPDRVGPWRILRELGHGGMGVVYLAERDDGAYRQTVALKLLQGGLRLAGFVDRFHQERQILARLNHPNIARLIDGGATPDGQPYYAMEFVEGESLTQYCRRHSLSIAGRIRLLLKICNAVSYAHASLVIHRDLKPANILVTAAGDPKLLDFGLAKLLDLEDVRDTTATAAPLTPLYASPEQIRGERLTTATDIYSLGVILYELIAGRLPYDAHDSSLFETWKAVCERPPLPPSAAAPKRPRASGDLDSIVLMALRKEAAERYSSVEALRADLERYLAGMPVAARRGSAAYRLRRFLARRRWAVTGVAAAVVGAGLSFAAVWWQEQRAALRFQQLRRLARSVVFELHDSIADLPGATAARKLLVQRSLEYLRSLEASSGRDLGLKWELAEAYKRIGEAQGDPSRANLGDSAGALDSLDRARSLLREIIAVDARNLSALHTLAAVEITGADIVSGAGNQDRALALRRAAIDILGRAAAMDSSPSAQEELGRAEYNLALNLTQTRDWPAAASAWRQTLAFYEHLSRVRPADPAIRRNVALSHKRLAAVCAMQNDYPAAIRHVTEAARIDRDRLAADPSSLEAKMDLAFDLSDYGYDLSRTDRFADAATQYEAALALRREVAAADPNDIRARTTVGRSLGRLADAQRAAGNLDAAIRSAREGAEILSAARIQDPSNHTRSQECAVAYANLGDLYRARAAAADWSAALSSYRKAVALFSSIPPDRLSPENRVRQQSLLPLIDACRRKL